MSVGLLLVAAVLAVNPFRVRAAVPADDSVRIAGAGAVVAGAVLAFLALVADPVVGALAVAASTFRMAVGVVLVLQGGSIMLLRLPSSEPRLAGRRAALVPVAFPVTLTPGLGLLAIAGALDQSAPVAGLLLAGALALIPVVVALWPSGRPTPDRVLSGVARAMGAGLVAVGVALLVNGIFDL